MYSVCEICPIFVECLAVFSMKEREKGKKKRREVGNG